MPFTAQLGTADSRPGNIVPGLGSKRFIPTLTTTTPASLVVEVAFPNNPIDLTGYRSAILGDGPTSYWRLDNATSCVDLAGNGNTLTLDNAPTLVSSALLGDPNQALSFNGTNQAGSVSHAASLSPAGNMTLKCWVKFPAAPGTTQTLVGKTKSYFLELRADRKVQFTVGKGASFTTLVSTTVLSTDTWYEVVCVYNGANLLIYLNGVQDASTAYTLGIDTFALPLTVARTDNSTASPSFRVAGTTATGSNGTTIAMGSPAATQVGDYLVASVGSGISNSIASAPAGWTLLGTSGSGAAGNQFVYGKVATAPDAGGSGSYTWTFGSSTVPLLGSIVAMTGVNAAAPFGRTAGANATSATSVSTSITPIFDNTTVLALFFDYNSGSSWTLTPGTKQFEGQAGRCAGETIAVGASASQSPNGSDGNTSTKSVFAVELVGPVAGSSFLATSVDEVSFWNLALTGPQVLTHYQQASVSPAPVVWTDISADVRECKIARGRQFELDQTQAGTATLLLKDAQRNYDPANTLSLYAPNVKPLRMIRIRALLNGIYYPRFRGYVERWESRWETGVEQFHAEIEVTAVDGFEPLALAAPTGTIAAGPSGVTIGSLLNKANWPGDQRIIDAGAFATAALTLDGSTSVLSYLQTVANGEAGAFFVDTSGNAVFHDKNHRSTSLLSMASQATFGDIPDGSLPFTALDPSFDKDKIINDWHVDDSAGGDHQASDQTSILAFFRRTQNRSTLLSAADATTMAGFLLSKTKDPGYRFDAIELTPNAALELWTQTLTREISDRITVEAQPVEITPAAQIKKDCWIERIEETWRHGQPTRFRWQLSPTPAPPASGYGDSTYGVGQYGTTAAGYGSGTYGIGQYGV